MAAIASYADILKQVIRGYAAIKPSYGDVQIETIFDDAQGHYELMYAGWHGSRRIHGAVIYRKLGVAELWFWKRGRIVMYVLHGETYAESMASSVLPGIDLAELVGYLDRPTASRAIRDDRAALQARPRR